MTGARFVRLSVQKTLYCSATALCNARLQSDTHLHGSRHRAAQLSIADLLSAKLTELDWRFYLTQNEECVHPLCSMVMLLISPCRSGKCHMILFADTFRAASVSCSITNMIHYPGIIVRQRIWLSEQCAYKRLLFGVRSLNYSRRIVSGQLD